jgi:hypothetical protein
MKSMDDIYLALRDSFAVGLAIAVVVLFVAAVAWWLL